MFHANIVPIRVITAPPVMPAIIPIVAEEPVLSAIPGASDTICGGPLATVVKPGMELSFGRQPCALISAHLFHSITVGAAAASLASR